MYKAIVYVDLDGKETDLVVPTWTNALIRLFVEKMPSVGIHGAVSTVIVYRDSVQSKAFVKVFVVVLHRFSDVDECSTSPCGHNEGVVCVNEPGTYRCQCREGFDPLNECTGKIPSHL